MTLDGAEVIRLWAERRQLALDYIIEHPGTTVPEMARGLNLPAGSVRNMAWTMVAKGLVDRRDGTITGGQAWHLFAVKEKSNG